MDKFFGTMNSNNAVRLFKYIIVRNKNVWPLCAALTMAALLTGKMTGDLNHITEQLFFWVSGTSLIFLTLNITWFRNTKLEDCARIKK